jgi:hypothetical protein
MAWYEDFNEAAAYTVKLSNLEITFHGLQDHRSRERAGLRTGWQTIFVQNLDAPQVNLLDTIFLLVAVLLL